jgi:sugar transferase EpsL
MNERPFQRAIKRMIDVSVAAMVLFACLPVIGVVAICIRCRMGRPILFRQQRPGLEGQPFTLCKFRTMSDTVGCDGRLLPDSDRLTWLGRFLRRTSLDELPQLWNVVCGQMSLVGPRPLLTEYLDYYTPEQARRHAVPPGITGLAQVNGRNAISWEEKFALDVWYVEHWRLGLDLQILLTTVWRVLRGDGISAAAHATMPKFTPSNRQWNNSTS